MALVTTVIIFLACVVLSQGQVQPGQCAFYEECGRNPSIGSSLLPPVVPCLSYSPARVLTGEHYRRLKTVCPMLDRGEKNTHACCSIKQLNSLDMSLSLTKSILIRCPSCADNFAHLHCINTCSPNQTQTVNVTETRNVTYMGQEKEVVLGYQAYLSAAFAEGSFNSCQNVRIPATGGFAIGTMCGRYGAKLCTAQRWYDFQGNSNNGFAPLDIDFKIIKPGDMAEVPKGMVPYSGRVLRCNETTPTGGESCSCQDCKESCPVMPPPPGHGMPMNRNSMGGNAGPGAGNPPMAMSAENTSSDGPRTREQQQQHARRGAGPGGVPQGPPRSGGLRAQ